MSNETVEQLDQLIRTLHKKGAYHRRRGFRLNEADGVTMSNHLLEECVELQAELHHGNYRTQINEAADVLGVFLHTLYGHGIPLKEVIARAVVNMEENFTLNPAEVTAIKPGFTRSSRS